MEPPPKGGKAKAKAKATVSKAGLAIVDQAALGTVPKPILAIVDDMTLNYDPVSRCTKLQRASLQVPNWIAVLLCTPISGHALISGYTTAWGHEPWHQGVPRYRSIPRLRDIQRYQGTL